MVKQLTDRQPRLMLEAGATATWNGISFSEPSDPLPPEDITADESIVAGIAAVHAWRAGRLTADECEKICRIAFRGMQNNADEHGNVEWKPFGNNEHWKVAGEQPPRRGETQERIATPVSRLKDKKP